MNSIVSVQKFFKGEPKALGVTQILIGLMEISLGIILAFCTYIATFASVRTAVPFWGGALFIVSGSLSVAAQNKVNMCLVKGSMWMNMISTIAAIAGIVLLSIDLEHTPIYGYHDCISESYNRSYCSLFKVNFRMVIQAIEGLMLALMVLEFCIAVSTSVFGYKATYCNSDLDTVRAEGQQQTYPL